MLCVDEKTVMLDFDSVEAMLVEAVELWRRSPGGGRWPFASDGPWDQVQRFIREGDYDARGGDMEDAVLRPLPLSRSEVAERDDVSAWLLHVADDADRHLVVLVLGVLARGRKVRWLSCSVASQ